MIVEQDQVVLAFGWWVGRNIQNNYYWGGSAPGTHKCACGLEGSLLFYLLRKLHVSKL